MKLAYRILLKLKPVKWIIKRLKQHPFPGSPEITWYAVIEFFSRWVDTRDISQRTAALTYTFVLALFPTVIFLFTLLAYIPVTRTGDVLVFFQNILPDSTFVAIESTLEDILRNQRGGLLSLGFVIAVYFSTNGFVSLMKAFDKYRPIQKKRSFWKQRLVALILSAIVFVALVLSVWLLTGGRYTLKWLDQLSYFPSKLTPFLLLALNYGIVAAIILTIISVLYYFAPSQAIQWKFISPGAVFATLVTLLSTIVFSAYVNAFNSYNKVYGSIGALIVIMLLIYINTYILLLGYELNVAIDKTVAQHKDLPKKKGNKLVLIAQDFPSSDVQ
ncbi:MAG: YihY/virulence factor BrkB family protein [Bacteroidota bacterium]